MTDASIAPPPTPAPAGAVNRPRNVAGLISFALACAAVALSIAATVVTFALVGNSALDFSAINTIAGVIGLISALFALAALIVGVVGLVLRNLPRGFAAAGAGIGGAHLLQAIVGLVAPALYGALLW